jgi:hypothetical protein
MSKILASMAAFALLMMLALPGPADAAERRANGLRTETAAPTELSSQRYWRRRHGYWGPRYRWGRRYAYWGPRYRYWGPRYRYWGPRYAYWGPRYRYWGPRYRYWRPRYAYWGYPYYWRPRPVIAFSIGFGPRWWW